MGIHINFPSKAKISKPRAQDDAPAAEARRRESAPGQLGRCERAIISVLAQRPDGCQHARLALLAGYTYNGSFRNALGTLRTAGVLLGANTGVMRASEELL